MKIKVIMYHYVRDMSRTLYPNIKALDVGLFRQQIEWLRKDHTFIDMELMIEAQTIGLDPVFYPNPVLLTFDDGFRDHFETVFPILDEYGIKGAFFVPAQPVTDGVVLDVHKIHHIISEIDDKGIMADIHWYLSEADESWGLKKTAEYWDEFAHATRYDTAQIAFIKRMLQKELPEFSRQHLIETLFIRATYNEPAFANDLYMSKDQIKTLIRHGHHVGGHSCTHPWMSENVWRDQEDEIDCSIAFTQNMGMDRSSFTFCYPYGDYNDSTKFAMRDFDIKAAFTTKPEIYDTEIHNRLEIPRLDCNDITEMMEA